MRMVVQQRDELWCGIVVSLLSGLSEDLDDRGFAHWRVARRRSSTSGGEKASGLFSGGHILGVVAIVDRQTALQGRGLRVSVFRPSHVEDVGRASGPGQDCGFVTRHFDFLLVSNTSAATVRRRLVSC